ncbi:hypothetical protein CMV_015433 [Castanea mollissima]|uniref:EF-1-gamma C-terminal domain-containing protein n=1 Tax=Castanea mollissima TaxID=60419 RepID=A0A8J4R960_9ROSI|nr:hypothetical protein CMV_015433 [Castanea mollissima]
MHTAWFTLSPLILLPTSKNMQLNHHIGQIGILQVPVLETPHDSGFESNAIACTRLKADNLLYGSSRSDYRMGLALRYAFGKMLASRSGPPFKVKLLWLLRGQDIPKFVLDECYDMELYEWKKVDIIDEEQKERVSQMIEDYEP